MINKVETRRFDVSSFGNTLDRTDAEIVIARNVEGFVLSTGEARKVIDSARQRKVEDNIIR